MNDNNYLNKFIAGFKCKNDLELKSNEVQAISTLFQIPSKETSLFAEIISTNSTDSHITTVKIPVRYRSSTRHAYKKLKKNIVGNMSCRRARTSTDSCVSSFNDDCLNTKAKNMIGKKCSKKKVEDEFESDEKSYFKNKDKKTEDTVVNNNIASQMFYQKIIESQFISGEWAHNNDKDGVMQIIKEKFDKEYKIVYDKFKLYNIESEPGKNIVLTILVIWILYKEYSNLKNEFFLIANKAKKFLMRFKIKYEDFESVLN